MAIRAQKIKLNPTPEQEQYFYRAAGVARFVWNWALDQYQHTKSLGATADWNETQKSFNRLKHEAFPFVNEVTKSAAQIAFADLRQAINTYYQVKQRNPKAQLRFPGRRKRSKKVGGFGLQNDQFSIAGNTVRIPKLGSVNMARPLIFGASARILSGRVKHLSGHWYLCLTLELSIAPVGATAGHGQLGIDFGLSRFATFSNGDGRETQAHHRRAERKLKLQQRSLARKKKGSRRRAKQKLKVARWHERVADQRRDFLHQMTTKLACLFAAICVEDLCLEGWMRSKLAKSTADAAIGEAMRQLEYKATKLAKVDRFFPSSARCHVCGQINEALRLSERAWVCPNPQCGTEHERDLNAAINILLEGLRLLAGTGWVGVSGVEFATATRSFGFAQAADCEAGSI